MDKGYEHERFESLSIKTTVAKKFRKYSREQAKSQSMTLMDMLEFFELNAVSPDQRLGETIASINSQLKKRFNAIIAIIKNIEKNQTKPTTAMLQRLFEEAAHEEEEEYDFGAPVLITENEELEFYRKGYEHHRQQCTTLYQLITQIIEKTSLVKKNFGGDYYRLEFSREDFENLTQQIENVYHHHSAENRK